jgi:hypothetical protein
MIKKLILRLWWCRLLKWHKWTSAPQKGLKPTAQQLTSAEGFWDYAKMYCERCGHVSELSKKMQCKYKD